MFTASKGFAFIILLCPAGSIAQGQSFECSDTTNQTEKEICYNSELSALDEIMATAYAKSFDYIDWMTSDELRNSQRNWIIERNNCGVDLICLRTSYASRLKLLAERLTDFDTINNYTKYAYAGEPLNGKCEDGAVLSKWGQCVHWANGKTSFRGISAGEDMAYSYWYVGSNMHICNIEGLAKRDELGWTAKKGGCEIKIAFQPHGLELKTNSQCDDWCGARARGMIDSILEY